MIALGYKGDYIKRWMIEYSSLQGDLTISLKDGKVRRRSRASARTGRSRSSTPASATKTGGRIKRLAPYLGDGTFMLTWGDGVADIEIPRLLEFHRAHGKLATLTAVRPPARFGADRARGRRPSASSPRSRSSARAGSTAPSSCSSPAVFDYIDGDMTRVGARAARAARRRRAADGVPPRRLLAVHGHAARQGAARAALGRASGRPGRSGPVARVLVTGHDGYIGLCWCRCSRAAGHEVVGLDSFLYRGCALGAEPDPACRRSSATSAT